jgi:multiple sugar transport system permease protein
LRAGADVGLMPSLTSATPPSDAPGPGAPQRPPARRSGLLLAVSLLFALPMLLLVLAPLRPPGLPPPIEFDLWLEEVSLQSFRDAFSLVPFGRALWNSAWVCAVAVPLTLLTASWAGLALVLLEGRARIALGGLLLVLAMVPVTAIWIPRFALFNLLGLVGTHVPLIAPALMGANPLFVLLYFVAMRRIPREVLEAARLEGAGILRVWWRIVMPQVRPTTAAIGLLAVVAFWGNFIDPLLYLREERDLTAPAMLQSLELLGSTNWSVFLAGALVITVPVVLAFVVAQRFLSSLERGSGWTGR